MIYKAKFYCKCTCPYQINKPISNNSSCTGKRKKNKMVTHYFFFFVLFSSKDINMSFFSKCVCSSWKSSIHVEKVSVTRSKFRNSENPKISCFILVKQSKPIDRYTRKRLEYIFLFFVFNIQSILFILFLFRFIYFLIDLSIPI